MARFSNESNYGRSLLSDQDFDRIGKQASDMLMSRLVLSGKFLVLERPDVAKLEREQRTRSRRGPLAVWWRREKKDIVFVSLTKDPS